MSHPAASISSSDFTIFLQKMGFNRTFVHRANVVWSAIRHDVFGWLRLTRINRQLGTFYALTGVRNMNPRVEGGVVSFDYLGRRLEFDTDGNAAAIAEVFTRGEYDPLLPSIQNCDVVDIGASYGDSAVFFSLNGAGRVLAYEPYPATYAKAVSNVRRNDAQNVQVVNAGVGDTATIRLDAAPIDTISLSMAPSESGVDVPVYSLKQIVEANHIDDACLKCDCEGHEYQIFLNSDRETLRKFKHMIIEYHPGDPASLESKLRDSGFAVAHDKAGLWAGIDLSDSAEVNRSSADNPFVAIGLINALRIGPQ